MKKERVIVELSGGVDSSVAAYLLKESGYDVIAVTFSVWKPGNVSDCGEKNCCDAETALVAKRVAVQLGIPHYNICLKEVFYDKVVKDFIDNYKTGLTPNPCVRCNQFIKFNLPAGKLKHLSPFKTATGHYAKIIYDEKTKRYKLYKGKDIKKDQSYFLYCLSQEALKNTLFPLADMTKENVRKTAHEQNLPTKSKRESQEICFVPGADYKKFFEDMEITSPKGAILDKNGVKLGEHNGILNYTVGQRRGMGISADKPLYIIKINAKENTLIAGKNKDLFTDTVCVRDINWISFDKPDKQIHAKVRIRYNMKEQDASIKPTGKNKAEVKFKNPVRAVTPGQSAVFYGGDEVLGGGIITLRG
ncbi:MAG: tRNA 2-thiouridine(34) synthase MnmA [Armatimonadota bacterium]